MIGKYETWPWKGGMISAAYDWMKCRTQVFCGRAAGQDAATAINHPIWNPENLQSV